MALDVPDAFFSLPLEALPGGFFRSHRQTSLTDRRKAAAFASIVHDLAVAPQLVKHLPDPAIPSRHLSTLEDPSEVETIADGVRRHWRLPKGPIPNVVELVEDHGAVVIRLPLESADVDAFSLPFADRPVIVLGADKNDRGRSRFVLGADKNDRGRSRFDAAHELGHLVLHGDAVWGTKEVETQAHRFAAAFLMPAQDIAHELPERVAWPVLFELKRKWHVSLAALLMRARTLGRMSEAAYLTAVKDASARGWRRREPIPLGEPEQPSALRRLLALGADRQVASALPGGVLAALADATGV